MATRASLSHSWSARTHGTAILLATLALLVTFSGPKIRDAFAATPRADVSVDAHQLLSAPETEDEFPAIGCDGQGRLWVAWVSYDGKQDRVLVSQQEESGWSEPTALSRGGDHWRCAIGRDGSDRLWVVWSENQEGNWDIVGKSFKDGQWSDAVRLTSSPGNDFAPQLAADGQGQLWMAWQAVVDTNFEILLARVTPEGLQGQQNVSQDPANDWEPALAAGRDGRLIVAWDSYRSGSYDVLVRELQSGKLGPILPVAASPAYEAHAAVAVDHQGRIWVAWDRAGGRWGRHNKSRERLHGRRAIGLACLDQGKLQQPAAELAKVLTGELATFCELPELLVDGSGRLWLFLRHVHDLTPRGFRPNGRRYQARGIWNFYALCCAGEQWSTPKVLPVSNGRNDMRLSACLGRSGKVWAAWAEDGRRPTRAEEPVNHNVHVASLSLPVGTPPRVATSTSTNALPELASGDTKETKRKPYTITAGGKTYRLVFGDTHRHTDISRCAMNYDGSLLDTYRYAIDAAGLDFLAISDHDQDLLKHRYDRKRSPLLGHAWWRSQKYCDLLYIKDRFLPIYGYEHGGSFKARGGHKNVLYSQRGMPCYEQDSPEELFAVLRGKDAVVVPHQLADGGSATDWSRWDRDFERVAEIFQARGSYEYFGTPRQAKVVRQGHYLWDALGKRVRIGVIASSDHGLLHSAYAGVFVDQFTRRGILEGLRARRSFGATETIVIDFRLGAKCLGQEVKVSDPPAFDVVVQGTAPIKQVQIVRGGKFVYTSNPDATECPFRYADNTLAPGQDDYYYVRVEQQNGEWAWSSAIWVKRQEGL